MSHRYIELFLNSTGGSSGMSLSGIGNFCGGKILNYYQKLLTHNLVLICNLLLVNKYNSFKSIFDLED